jgi:histidine triad (HIT) family protein
VLVIPREHVVDLRDLATRPDIAAPYVAAIAKTADALDVGAFRTVFNTGAEVGQSVFHIHAHVLAGRMFGWPPG